MSFDSTIKVPKRLIGPAFVMNLSHSIVTCVLPIRIVENICLHLNPDLNPAVNETYCQPLLESLPDGQFKEDCVLHCVNYISKARGDCCEFACNE